MLRIDSFDSIHHKENELLKYLAVMAKNNSQLLLYLRLFK